MDDLALIAPDTWSGKNEYIAKRRGHDNSIFILPPRKQFYCTKNRVEVALLSSDVYLSTGVRFLLEGVRDIIFHVYKNHGKLRTTLANKLDLLILSASDAKDIPAIYRIILKLRLTGNNSSIVVIANDDARLALANIAGKHSDVTVLSSRENLSALKQEIMKRLTERDSESEKQNKYFPATLTPRQIDILFLAAKGLSPEDIALHSGVCTSTIYTTRARVLDKAGASSKMLEAVLYSQLRDGMLHRDLLHHDCTTFGTTRYNYV